MKVWQRVLVQALQVVPFVVLAQALRLSLWSWQWWLAIACFAVTIVLGRVEGRGEARR